jgi:hypothetical protein
MLPLVLVWLAVVDGGAPAAPAPKPRTAEDLEVIQNLGLLEDLESATELEALEELSLER